MDLNNLLRKLLVQKATSEILPMDSDKPKFGTKTKLAGIFAVIAAVAGALSQFFGG